MARRASPSRSQRMNPFGEEYQDPNAERLDSLTPAMLMPAVRRALRSETAEPLSWEYELIKGRGGDSMEGLGVYRFSGCARDRGQDAQWAMMLKIIRPSEDGAASHAGKREVLAYQSGFLGELPGGLAAPQCFGITNQPDGTFWMWIEEIVDEIGLEWPLGRYGLAARHLGQLNGTYLSGEPLPSFDWLSRRWLRKYTAQYTAPMAQLDENLSHPLMRRICPPDFVSELRRLWTMRETWLDAIERLPQTFCHMDAFRRNLFARPDAEGQEETVAIDWPYAGIGAIGEELAPLVSMGLGRLEVSLDDLRHLDRVVFKGYLDGLRDAGWNGDPKMARFGLAASAPLRYAFMSTRFLEFFRSLDEKRRVRLTQRIEAELDKNARLFAYFLGFLFELAEEAEALLPSLNLPD